jgi:hypothetical protein
MLATSPTSGTDADAVALASGGHVGEHVALNLPDGVPDGGRIEPAASH